MHNKIFGRSIYLSIYLSHFLIPSYLLRSIHLSIYLPISFSQSILSPSIYLSIYLSHFLIIPDHRRSIYPSIYLSNVNISLSLTFPLSTYNHTVPYKASNSSCSTSTRTNATVPVSPVHPGLFPQASARRSSAVSKQVRNKPRKPANTQTITTGAHGPGEGKAVTIVINTNKHPSKVQSQGQPWLFLYQNEANLYP